MARVASNDGFHAMASFDQQEVDWESLYQRIIAHLAPLASEGLDKSNDCWVDDDNIGTLQQKIYVTNLELLRPAVIKDLQSLLKDFPGWEIMVAIDVDRTWPVMGLTIRAHEIVDGLQRQYFPEPYRKFFYEGSRRGTDLD